MQALDTRKHAQAPSNEAPAGILVRGWALTIAVVFSLLLGGLFLFSPGLADGSPLWLVWAVVTIACIVVYAIGTLAFRRSPQRQSRRMQRWLKAGTS